MRVFHFALFLLADASLRAESFLSGHITFVGEADPVLAAALDDARRLLGPACCGGVELKVTLSPEAPPLLPPPGSPPEDFREGWSAEVVSIPQQSSVRILARDSDSAAAGIYAYLRAATGVTWYGPGAWEESLPARDTWKLPSTADLARRSPFVNRHVSGLFKPAEQLWARRMGLRQFMSSGHNFTRLFTVGELAAHPEWLGQRDGKPTPVPQGGYAWQVDLTNDATANHALQKISAWSKESPEARVFSLGVNDTTAFPDAVLAQSQGWFRDRPDLSNPVFAWTSKVAAQRPDLWFTALAYYYAENAPSAPVAPNVIPWLTADRTAWSNPAFRAEETALMERWHKSGAEIIGIYDYLYGVFHLFPRSFEPTLADSLPTAHRLGVRAYTSELYPVWGFDGPKAYLLARLLDDPTLDPKPILKNYFQHQFGPAAPAAERFWKRAAEAWARTPGPVRWIKFYRDDNQLACLTNSDLRALRRELNAMLSSGAEGANAENIHRLAEAWEVTEMAARLHRLWQGAEKAPTAWKEARETLARRLADPLFRAGENSRLADASYLLNTEPVEKEAFKLLPPNRKGAEVRINLREGAVADLSKTRRTLEDPTMASWTKFQRSNRPTPAGRIETKAPSTLMVSGEETLRLGRTLPVVSGELFAVGCLAEGTVGPSSPVAMELVFLDGLGRQVKPKRRERVFGEGKPGRWPLLIADQVPARAEWAIWTFVIEFQEKGDRLELSQPFSASGTW